MFCNNCGKEIPDKTLFCTYCGEKVAYNPKAVRKNSNKEIAEGTYLMIGMVISAIVAVSFLVSACLAAKQNSDLFEWFDDSVKVVGHLLHWGICLLLVVESVIFIFLLRIKHGLFLLTRFGILLSAEGVVLKILEAISDNDNMMSNEVSIALYRVFHITYGNAAWINIIMGIILIIFGTRSKKTLAK